MTIILKNTIDIKIGEMVKFSVDDFLEMSGEHVVLWCNGYLLAFNAVNPERFDDELMNKNIREYRNVDYALMRDYTPEIKNKSNFTIRVIDYSDSKIANRITGYLHES